MNPSLGLTVFLCFGLAIGAIAAPDVAAIMRPPKEDKPAPESRPAPDSQPTTTQSQPATTTAATTQAAPEVPAYLAVVNGRVHTVTGLVLDRATVLIKDGVIVAIGSDVHIPQSCRIVDADGFHVYPGLIAAVSGGLHGGGNPEDTTSLFSLSQRIALAGGITTAFSGQNAAKLTFDTTEGLLLKSGIYFDIGYTTRNPLGRAELRADIERVRDYLREVQRHERQKRTDPNANAPDKEWLKGKYENYRKLLAGELVAFSRASSAQELRDLADLAGQYGFKLVVSGAVEGWLVASELGRAGVDVIITPRAEQMPDPNLNRPSGSSIENARILRAHGVTVAVVPASPAITLSGLAGRDLLHLNMEAAFTVRGGLSNDDALRTITIDAARVLGIDDRVGSLEVGKDGDLVVCDGDLLHYMTQVHYTIVNGRVVYEKSKDTLYAHIRPEGPESATAFDDQWPRPLAWPAEE